MNSKMRAIRLASPGKAGQLVEDIVDIPSPGPGQVRLRIAYAGLNRADLFQVEGRYPAPVETGMIPGLEVSGWVDALGEGVHDLSPGQPVCALLIGGGYAEYCVADAGLVIPLPSHDRLKEAAGLPEALLTNWRALVRLGEVNAGQCVLLSGGSSGIGSFAISMLRALDVHSIALAGSAEKREFCSRLGATAVDYRSANLLEALRASAPQGVDVALDMLGGSFPALACELLNHGGKLVSIALLEGARVELHAGRLLLKNLHWMGMTLRSLPTTEKAEMLREALNRLGPALSSGQLRPALDQIFPLEAAEKAHARMQQRLHLGKILLEVSA